jgi:hypothetical protein
MIVHEMFNTDGQRFSLICKVLRHLDAHAAVRGGHDVLLTSAALEPNQFRNATERSACSASAM